MFVCVNVILGRRLSNGQNYATVCPNLIYLWRHSRTVDTGSLRCRLSLHYCSVCDVMSGWNDHVLSNSGGMQRHPIRRDSNSSQWLATTVMGVATWYGTQTQV